VLVAASTPEFQYSLKKTGKKPAITVVAKAEFAQSYMAQPHFCRVPLTLAVIGINHDFHG